MDKYEVIKFKDNEFEMDVNVSPDEDTVWLSLNEICKLFDRDKSVISRHIKNILLEEVIEEKQVVAKNATTASDNKTYIVNYYNLDMIISIGYRVKSNRGILFRRWSYLTKTILNLETK